MRARTDLWEPGASNRLGPPGQVLYSKYYADFPSFSGAITDCLAQTHTQHKAALDSLLTLRFQTLQEPHNLAA